MSTRHQGVRQLTRTNTHYQKVMKKPIGYYCPYAVGNGGVLEEIEQSWGSYYEQLSHDEKLWLLAQLSRQLWIDFADSSNIREGVIVAANRLQAEIPPDLRMGMIQALCDQVKS